MKKKLFSLNNRKVHWKKVAILSILGTLTCFVLGFLFWYFVLYLPIMQRISDSNALNKELQQAYQLDMKTLPPTPNVSSTPSTTSKAVHKK